MGNKMNVQQMLEQAVLDNVDTQKKTQELKDQRNTGIFKAGAEKGSESDNTDSSGLEGRLARAKLSEQKRKKVEQFLELMQTENYVDKKEQFIFRLSKSCFLDYESLTNVYNYKMGEKATRNDIMRKVLELFHSQYIPELIKNLERL